MAKQRRKMYRRTRALCLGCRYDWTAAILVRSEKESDLPFLECPRCHTLNGVESPEEVGR